LHCNRSQGLMKSRDELWGQNGGHNLKTKYIPKREKKLLSKAITPIDTWSQKGDLSN